MDSDSASDRRLARRAVISGRVQGVWFRDSVRRLAHTLGVAGWARNLSDGSVEVWAEGPADSVQKLLEFAHEGPPRAIVQHVEVEDVPSAGVERFEVR